MTSSNEALHACDFTINIWDGATISFLNFYNCLVLRKIVCTCKKVEIYIKYTDIVLKRIQFHF